jgi:hypothetical protein
MCSTRVVSGLIQKHLARLKRLAKDKHPSLFTLAAVQEEKKFFLQNCHQAQPEFWRCVGRLSWSGISKLERFWFRAAHLGPVQQNFLQPLLMPYRNKLECLPLSETSTQV